MEPDEQKSEPVKSPPVFMPEPNSPEEAALIAWYDRPGANTGD